MQLPEYNLTYGRLKKITVAVRKPLPVLPVPVLQLLLSVP